MGSKEMNSDAVKEHENIYQALLHAQQEMTAPVKNSKNNHFNTKYADLSAVVQACMSPLNKNGITLMHIPSDNDGAYAIKTILHHVNSGTSIEAVVPLITDKGNMQGYKSAVTYAKRIGLESLTGLAPDDDDGNDAVKFAPKKPSSAHMKRSLAELDNDLVDVTNIYQYDKLSVEWKKKMKSENWPEPKHSDDETAYRNIVKDKFIRHKQTLTDSEPNMERCNELHTERHDNNSTCQPKQAIR